MQDILHSYCEQSQVMCVSVVGYVTIITIITYLTYFCAAWVLAASASIGLSSRGRALKSDLIRKASLMLLERGRFRDAIARLRVLEGRS